MLVMSIMISVPIFTIETYVEPTVSFDKGLSFIYLYYIINFLYILIKF